MKKIENLLLLLPLLLIVVGEIFIANSTIDIHLHDTYYVVSPIPMALRFTGWLIILFILYKVIRKRHGSINNKWAIPHILISTIFIGIILFSYLFNPVPRRFLSNSPETVMQVATAYQRYNQLLIVSSIIFLSAQVIFLLYFITMMIKPRPSVNSR